MYYFILLLLVVIKLLQKKGLYYVMLCYLLLLLILHPRVLTWALGMGIYIYVVHPIDRSIDRKRRNERTDIKDKGAHVCVCLWYIYLFLAVHVYVRSCIYIFIYLQSRCCSINNSRNNWWCSRCSRCCNLSRKWCHNFTNIRFNNTS